MRVLVVLALALSAKVSPIEKTIQLLTELQEKVVKDGENSQKLFEEFGTQCKDGSVQTQFEIKTSTAASERASATVQQNAATVQSSDSKIGELSSAIATNEADLASATAIRKQEKADFENVDADLAETIDMIGRAAGIIERNMKGKSFVQTENMQNVVDALQLVMEAGSVSSRDKAKLQALMQTDDSELAPAGAPAAAAFENQSGGILQTLQDMLDRSQATRGDAQKAEMNAAHDFNMLKQKLENTIAQQNKELKETKATKAAAQEAGAIAQSELDAANADTKEAKEKLAKMQHGCMTHASDFETEQHERAGELDALAQAKSILEEKTGGAASRAYSFLQIKTKAPMSQKVLGMIQKLATEDKDISMLASRIESASQMSANPFGKVKSMISEMIEKLTSEAAKEASHKAYCDKEMSETTAKREDKQDEVDDLDTKIDSASAKIAKLGEAISTLHSELAAIAKEQKEATELRNSEAAAWASAKVDYESGVEGVGMALQVLREYYAEKEEGAFMQTAKHTKSSNSASGIIGLLEVVESDFSQLLAEGSAAESAAQKEYDTNTQENRVSTAVKSTELKMSEKSKKETEAALSELNADREGASTELAAIVQYWDQLQPICIAKPESYAERKARREAEIDGLKDALRVLEEESAPSFLQVRRA